MTRFSRCVRAGKSPKCAGLELRTESRFCLAPARLSSACQGLRTQFCLAHFPWANQWLDTLLSAIYVIDLEPFILPAGQQEQARHYCSNILQAYWQKWHVQQLLLTLTQQQCHIYIICVVLDLLLYWWINTSVSYKCDWTHKLLLLY